MLIRHYARCVARPLGEIALAVKRLQVRHHRALDAALTPFGMTLVQWDALRHLHENPGASLHDLALLTFQTDQSMGALAGRMIERGLIERMPAGGRAVRHRLTERGEQVRSEAQATVDGVLAESFAGLRDDEVEVLGELMARLVTPTR